MKRLSVCTAFVIMYTYSPEVTAQPSSPPLPDTLSAFIAKSTHLVPSERERLVVLGTPLPLPSVPLANLTSTKGLVPLWSVPTVGNDNRAALGERPISSVFQEYFNKEDSFILGAKTLDENAKTRLATALSILYADPDIRSKPTNIYARYRMWQEQRAEIIKLMQVAPTAGDKVSLNQKLIDLDQDYSLLGQKERIETAIEVVSKTTSDAPNFQTHFQKIRELATPEQDVVPHAQLLKRVGSPAAWARIASNVEAANLPATIDVAAGLDGGSQQSFSIPIIWISCQAIHARLDQPLLSADILGNRAWKRRDGRVLSTGTVGVENAGSIPNYVSSVLIVRDLEIEFDTKSDAYEKVANVLSTASRATIGKIPVDFRGPGAAYLLPGRLYIPRPTVIAIVIATPSRLPNSAEDLVWK